MKHRIPTRKVSAGALAGAFSVVVISLLSSFDVKVSAELASSITVISSFLVSYYVPEAK
jgi:putative flippase GtrA